MHKFVLQEGELVRKEVLLVNKPSDPPVGMQALHVDDPPGPESYITLVPLAPISVVVRPGSHHAVMTCDVYRKVHPQAVGLIRYAVSSPVPVRLLLEPGEMVLLHGNMVHAGGKGRPTEWSPRIHLYVKKGGVLNETHPVEALPPVLASVLK